MKTFLITTLAAALLVGCSLVPGPEQKQAQGSSSNTAPQLSVTTIVSLAPGEATGAATKGSGGISVITESAPAAAPNAASTQESKQDSKQDIKVDPESVGKGVKTAAEGAVPLITGEGVIAPVKPEAPKPEAPAKPEAPISPEAPK